MLTSKNAAGITKSFTSMHCTGMNHQLGSMSWLFKIVCALFIYMCCMHVCVSSIKYICGYVWLDEFKLVCAFLYVLYVVCMLCRVCVVQCIVELNKQCQYRSIDYWYYDISIVVISLFICRERKVWRND
jgi:hypothetical protein